KLWRGLLYAFLFVSFIRQLQMSNMEIFHRITWFAPPLLIYIVLATIIFILSAKFARAFQTYVSYLAFGSAILTLMFVWRCLQSGFPETSSQNANPANNETLHPIIFLVFDELSLQHIMKDGEINREKFPNFASLASDSVWFENAMTNHFETAEALPT